MFSKVETELFSADVRVESRMCLTKTARCLVTLQT